MFNEIEQAKPEAMPWDDPSFMGDLVAYKQQPRMCRLCECPLDEHETGQYHGDIWICWQQMKVPF